MQQGRRQTEGWEYLGCMQTVGKGSKRLPVCLTEQSTPHQEVGLVLRGHPHQLSQSQHLHINTLGSYFKQAVQHTSAFDNAM